MKTIAIVYFSGSGHTALVAEAVQRGALRVADTRATLHPIDGRDIVEGRFKNDSLLTSLTAADAIVFGAATYMAGPAAQFKAFADATGGIWYQRQWRDKLAAGFTHSSSPSGDKLNTLHYFAALAAQHGMTWINNTELPSGAPGDLNRVGSYLGVMGYGNGAPDHPPALHPGDALTAEALGRRIAELAHQFSPASSRVAA